MAGGKQEQNGFLLDTAELYGNFLPGTIHPGFTGSWYDPAQVGHGLFVEVLPDNRFLAAWFTFDPAGDAAGVLFWVSVLTAVTRRRCLRSTNRLVVAGSRTSIRLTSPTIRGER